MNHKKLDAVRGYEMRKDPITTVAVHMYIDQPGVYIDLNGNRLSSVIARRAGFDVDGQEAALARREKLAAFQDKLDGEMEIATGKRKVIAEQGDYLLIDAGLGRVFVEDVSGARVLVNAVPLIAGKQFLKDFAEEAKLAKEAKIAKEAENGGAKA